MRAFTYLRPASLDDAVAGLARAGTVPLGGGTDLLVCVDEGIATPASVIDLRGIGGFDDIVPLPDGGLRIGAAARVGDIAAHEDVRARFRMLAEACDAVGSPALRTMGTLGGNLCQRPRCWYFRRAIPCFKNGGSGCPAREGENQYHAILDGGPCYIVHPSDPAVALTALDAEIEIAGPNGISRIPITQFFALPRDRMEHETVLRAGEIVTAITLPAVSSESHPAPGASRHSAAAKQLYRKIMQRGSWDFALASIAAMKRADGAVRLVLGGVAPRPWRVAESVEEDVASGGLDEESIAALAERALYDAEPLAKNVYKVTLASSLLRDAIRELTT